MSYADKLIELKRAHIHQCETLKYEIQQKPIKSRLDKDKVQTLDAQIMRIDAEIEELQR